MSIYCNIIMDDYNTKYTLVLYEIYKFLFRLTLFYHHNLVFRVDFSVKFFQFLTLDKWNFFTNVIELMVRKNNLLNLSSLLYLNPSWISKLENLFNIINVNVCHSWFQNIVCRIIDSTHSSLISKAKGIKKHLLFFWFCDLMSHIFYIVITFKIPSWLI